MPERRDETSEIELDLSDVAERRTLIWVVCINFLQVVVAGTVGVVADSTGLLGAALDNLADAGVYAVSLYAVGRTVVAKSRVAALSGALLVILGVALLAEVLRRFFVGAEPIGLAMIVVAIANAATNLICLRLLRSHRGQGVHMQASWIFTTNDMLANLGIAVSGAAVMLFASPLPDLIIGLVVGGLVLKGGWEILREARDAQRASALAQKD
jgi:Co/Zn/Cd efflux system component